MQKTTNYQTVKIIETLFASGKFSMCELCATFDLVQGHRSFGSDLDTCSELLKRGIDFNAPEHKPD